MQILTTASDTTTKLDATYENKLILTGTGVLQWYNLGDTAGYGNGKAFVFVNGTNEFVGVRSNHATAASAAVWERVPPGATLTCYLADATTTGGASGGEKEGTWIVARSCYRPEPERGFLWVMDGVGLLSSSQHYGDPGYTSAISGTGASIGSGSVGNSTHIGTYILSTGTTTTGYALQYLGASGQVQYLGSAARHYECLASVSGLSTVAEEYIARFGPGDNITGGAHTNGVYFLYDRATNGDFWAIRNINATSNNTVVTAVAPTAGTTGAEWQRLRVEISSGTARSDWWIDRVQVSASGGLATYLPLTSTALKLATRGITKTAGTTSRYLKIDYESCSAYFTTTR